VLEVFGQKVSGELRRVPNNEAVVCWTPRHNRVRRRVVHHVVRLAQERRRRVSVRNRCRRRRRHISAPTACSLHFTISIIKNLNRKLKEKKMLALVMCNLVFYGNEKEKEKLKP